jgi:hypothetical protein
VTNLQEPLPVFCVNLTLGPDPGSDLTVAGLLDVHVASVMVACHLEQLTVQGDCQKMKMDHHEDHLLLNVAYAAFL